MPPVTEVLVLVLAGVGLAFANTLASAGSALSLPVLLAAGSVRSWPMAPTGSRYSPGR